jgi:hypothetical protein
MLLDLQLRVEPRRVALFLGVDLFGPGIEATEPDLRPPQRAAVEPQRLLGQPGQEGAVVADDDEGTAIAR